MNFLWLYAALLAIAVAAYLLQRTLRRRHHARVLAASQAAGLAEPVSLHPVVDPGRCIGSGGCTRACPAAPRMRSEQPGTSYEKVDTR